MRCLVGRRDREAYVDSVLQLGVLMEGTEVAELIGFSV